VETDHQEISADARLVLHPWRARCHASAQSLTVAKAITSPPKATRRSAAARLRSPFSREIARIQKAVTKHLNCMKRLASNWAVSSDGETGAGHVLEASADLNRANAAWLSGFSPECVDRYIAGMMGVGWHTRPQRIQAGGYGLRPVVQRGKRPFRK
jgi:hypothetical protein